MVFDPNQTEVVTIVDEENRVIGAETRSRMRDLRLIHRASYVLVFNQRGELFVQRRTATKDIYPEYCDVAAGGVVLQGESYEECAEREINEEMGILDVPLKCLFDFYHEDSGNRVWGRAFAVIYEGAIILQEEEVQSGGFQGLGEILRNSLHEPFTPDGMYVLMRYLGEEKAKMHISDIC